MTSRFALGVLGANGALSPLGFEPMGYAQISETPLAGALFHMVGAVGFEPTILSEADFKSAASANFATPPVRVQLLWHNLAPHTPAKSA